MSKLEEILKYVSEHNDFYKNRIKEYGITNPLDITQWPVLTRKELQENRYNMFSDGYKSKYFNQQLRRQSSSGSSGVPVNVYWDYKDWYASNMSLWRKRLQWYGIHPNERYVMFTLNAFGIKADEKTVYFIREPENVLSVNVSLIQTEEQYKKLVNIINEFNPAWLYIQPFVLNKLVRIYKKYDIKKPMKLRYIESVGELLPSDLKRRAVEFFEVPLANMYGSEEMNGIAYECPNHQMYVLNDNVLIEVQDGNGIHAHGEGEVIITNLNNTAMPLIRYSQGDQIVTDNMSAEFPYDYEASMIQLLKGRTIDYMKFEGEIEINSFMLSELIAEVNNQFNDIIKEYEFIFSKLNKKLVCKLYFDDSNKLWFYNIKREIEGIFLSKTIGQDIVIEVICAKNQQTANRKNKIFEIVR